jgi:hypothetical protein
LTAVLVAAVALVAFLAPAFAEPQAFVSGVAADPPQPPVLKLRILSPEDGALVQDSVVKLQVLVRTTAKGAITLRALVNGQPPEPPFRGLTVRAEPPPGGTGERPRDVETLHTLELAIPKANCRVAVVAEADGVRSTSAELQLRWVGTSDFVVKPTLYLLAVGVSHYRDPALSLRYPSKDADDFVRALRRQEGGLYERVEARVLLDEQATRDQILDGMQWLQEQTTAKDVAILFLAGHGDEDLSTSVYYFLPHDADVKAIRRSMISQQELQLTLRSLAGKGLLFLDTCHAAGVMAGVDLQRRSPPDVSRVVQELSSVDNGTVIYAAATGRQLSQESSSWNNGAFTKAVVEGLLGRAAYYPNRPITIQMLFVYVSERVKQLTGGMQTPLLVMPQAISDFPLAIDLPTPPEPPPALAPALPLISIGMLPAPVASNGVKRGSWSTPLYKKAGLWIGIGVSAAVLAGLVTGAVYLAKTVSAVNVPYGSENVLDLVKVE